MAEMRRSNPGAQARGGAPVRAEVPLVGDPARGPRSATCANCRNLGSGDDAEYYHGRVADYSVSGEITYEFDSRHHPFICDSCVSSYMYRCLGQSAALLLSGAALMLGAFRLGAPIAALPFTVGCGLALWGLLLSMNAWCSEESRDQVAVALAWRPFPRRSERNRFKNEFVTRQKYRSLRRPKP